MHNTVDARIIFDKFSNQETYNAKYDARLRANPNGVRYFHDARIREIFDNKLKTYIAFSEYAIPTVKINLDTEEHITFAKNKLHATLSHNHFTEARSESFVLKDKYGSGGHNVFKINTHTKLKPIGKRDESISYVLQPFITASGFTFTDYSGNIDLRVIVCNGEIMQCYIRIPKQNEFRANASQGGTLIYIDVDSIPADVVTMARAINADLPVHDGFYALDFMKSSTGHLYFIEGNSTPGLNWYSNEDEHYAKQLMRMMIQKIKTMLR